MTQDKILVTILIDNYNYGRFLRRAIDSALNQTYPHIEVVVVDDGSTDDSREIISSYGGSGVKPIFKNNGGQASAFNSGIAASRGEIICLLDADDFFHPDKVDRVVPLCQPGSMLYHRLRIEPGDETTPRVIAPKMDYYLYARRYGFVPYMASPTSGLVLRRDLALQLIPLPTEGVRFSADDFVIRRAALLGEVIGIPDVLATYCIHGENGWCGKSHLKSREFMTELQKYLNQALIAAAKDPLIDFYSSMHAFEYVPQTPAGLAQLAIAVVKRHADLRTLNFSFRTLLCAARCALGLYTPVAQRKNYGHDKKRFALP